MRVKANGALVRLVMPANPKEEQVLVDDKGYVSNPLNPLTSGITSTICSSGGSHDHRKA